MDKSKRYIHPAQVQYKEDARAVNLRIDKKFIEEANALSALWRNKSNTEKELGNQAKDLENHG